MGTVQVTRSGKRCQAWSANRPHVPNEDYTDDTFPDGSREAANSYCRNPDDSYSDGVWCYTMELCDVPLCGKYVAE